MSTIRVLDESVANKIAAGEVVERPSSVVKELIENALDAGARRITIELMGAGRDLIRVTDDGEGMSAEDAQLAILPHATSKIRTLADLAAIETFGFRGEALPSIAAVSHLVLVTRRPDDEAGTMVASEGGAAPHVEPVGCPPGTSVAVRHLFFNTPARLKFLRHNRTELGRCLDQLGRLALAFPDVGFVVLHEGREVFRCDPTDDLRVRMADVLGREAVGSLVEFDSETPLLRASGFAGDLTAHRADRSGQYFFVNRRSIRSGTLASAVSRAYEGLLPAGRQPVVCLFVEMDPRLVDPNVHPTKQEVRFPREADVFRDVLGAVRSGLLAADLIPELPAGESGASRPDWRVASSAGAGRQRPLTRPLFGGPLDAFRAAVARRADDDDPDRADAEGAQRADAPPAAGVGGEQEVTPRARVLGQALCSYIVAETDGEILLVDQHAAHERVLYERFMAAFDGRFVESQGLLVPVTVELSAAEAALVAESAETFSAIGLAVEPFGGTAVVIRGVPALGRDLDPEKLLREVLQDVSDEDGEFSSVKDMRERVCASAACRAAVRQGERLAASEMEALLADLGATGVRFTCPHARPAVIRLGQDAIERHFGRR